MELGLKWLRLGKQHLWEQLGSWKDSLISASGFLSFSVKALSAGQRVEKQLLPCDSLGENSVSWGPKRAVQSPLNEEPTSQGGLAIKSPI